MSPEYHFQASVDEKGRLNVPAELADDLTNADTTEFFCTSLDGRVAVIFPKALWEQNRLLLEANPSPHAKRQSTIARYLGGESKLDRTSKGARIMLPQVLRAKIDLERQSVWLDGSRGVMRVMNRTVYQEELDAAIRNAQGDLAVLEPLGYVS
jgi:DNA-binding transcriptional regulator/RsmH inhibitor MraZ